MPKPKSKRRSASSYFTPSASVVGNSVGGVCGGAEAASSAPVMESVSGEDINVVGGDDMGNIYIGHGDKVTKVEVCEDTGAGTDPISIEDSVFVSEEDGVVS